MEEVKQPLTQEEADKIEKAFFEEGEPVRLRDGKVYILKPLVLKKARQFMRNMEGLDITTIALNFLEEENEAKLMESLLLGFEDYPEVTTDTLMDICDLRQAKDILRILIDLNGLKK